MPKPKIKKSNVLCSLPRSLRSFLSFLSRLAELGLCVVPTDELC